MNKKIVAIGIAIDFLTGCAVPQPRMVEERNFMRDFAKVYGDKVSRFADYNSDGRIVPEESKRFWRQFYYDHGWEIIDNELKERRTGREILEIELLEMLKIYNPFEFNVVPTNRKDGEVFI